MPKCDTYPPVISKEIYEKEITMCREHNRTKGHCCWGNCKECGVLPLLYKLHTGKIIHGEELDKFKEDIFQNDIIQE